VSRNTREDVVQAAGRLFAERGYHGTSMRDLGRELGLLGSSLYSHVAGKQELLVEVIERGAALFQASADAALAAEGSAAVKLRTFVSGHIAVVLDHLEEARTFLNEARAVEEGYRRRVLAARDRYETSLRELLAAGVRDGSFRAGQDPKLAGIFILSVLNALDRWYDETGEIDRPRLVDEVFHFVRDGIG
jgi:AcrR family transcriptional regulator